MDIPEPQGCEGIFYRLFMGAALVLAVAVMIALL